MSFLCVLSLSVGKRFCTMWEVHLESLECAVPLSECELQHRTMQVCTVCLRRTLGNDLAWFKCSTTGGFIQTRTTAVKDRLELYPVARQSQRASDWVCLISAGLFFVFVFFQSPVTTWLYLNCLERPVWAMDIRLGTRLGISATSCFGQKNTLQLDLHFKSRGWVGTWESSCLIRVFSLYVYEEKSTGTQSPLGAGAKRT